ncbi:MAG: serine hydrolase, partial [Anaerolineales bacterium]|nr:serine hydrolase [Anaerolineales bacterium]
SGRKFPILLSGILLGDERMASPTKAFPKVEFGEDNQTRYGEFPYCREMRHGSFSVSKSMGASIALLRLAEKYGEGVFDLKITDYVQPPGNASAWQLVTFGDALNMATGIGNGPDWGVTPNMMMFDEYTWQFNDFSQAKSAQEKLKVAFSYVNYAWGPGEVARYNSTTLFVLSAAMDGYLKSMDGPQADIWEMVVEEVYRPIGILYAPTIRTTEPDGSPGLPILAYGLYPTAEDLQKVMEARGLKVKPGEARGKLIGQLLEEFVEPSLIQPTFLYDYPRDISPLAKNVPGDPSTVERFEGFVNGMELCNAFTELNDPMEQEKRFLEMGREYAADDEERHPMDEDYLRAMAYGMPPQGGFGMGIDRLTMLLTDNPNIREVILFPHLRKAEE